jgi:hypothetical protein
MNPPPAVIETSLSGYDLNNQRISTGERHSAEKIVSSAEKRARDN